MDDIAASALLWFNHGGWWYQKGRIAPPASSKLKPETLRHQQQQPGAKTVSQHNNFLAG
jgi:hypothetical protein